MAEKKILIAPSLLSADFLHLADQIRLVEESGADWLHLDVMDGHFVPNLSIGPAVVAACQRMTRLPLDIHLMVMEPEPLLEAFAKAGADHLTVHVEASHQISDTLERIHKLGVKAGITLKPATPVSSLTAHLPYVDGVLVMSVDPGFSGQTFLPGAVERISEVRLALDNLKSNAWLAVDGGVNATSAALARAAGANVFISGSGIFQDPKGIPAALQTLRTALA